MALDPRIMLAAQAPRLKDILEGGMQGAQDVFGFAQQMQQAPIQNRLLQQAADMGDVKLETARGAQQDAEQQRELQSIAQGYLDIKPFISDANPDVPSAQRALARRYNDILKRGGDPSDTLEAMELVGQGNFEELRNLGEAAVRESGVMATESKVGRFRTFTDESGITYQQDSATGNIKEVSRPQPIDISGLPEGVQDAVRNAPRAVQEKVVSQFATPAAIEKAEQQKASKVQKASDAQAAIDKIDELFKDDAYKAIYGSFQGAIPSVMGSSVDAEAARDQIVGLLSLESRQKLKGQGTITDSEAATLEKSATILANPRISDEAAARELDRVRRVFEDARSRAGGKAGSKKEKPSSIEDLVNKYAD